jgi:dsRNA-specific ribonuclease
MSIKSLSLLKPLPHFPDPYLLTIAFTHKSIDKEVGKNYEKFEFLGDSFLELIVSVFLFNRYQNCNTNSIKPLLISNKSLNELSQIYNLSSLMITNASFPQHSKLHADLLESYLGAGATFLFMQKVNDIKYLSDLVNWIESLMKTKISKSADNVLKFYSIKKVLSKKKNFYIKQEVTNRIKLKKTASRNCIQQVGKSMIRFVITLILCEKNPYFNEEQLTKAREGIYSSRSYKYLCKYLPAEMNKGMSIIGKKPADNTKILNICLGYYFLDSYTIDTFPDKLSNIKSWLSLTLLNSKLTGKFE